MVMDWKSLLDDLQKQTDGIVKQAEAKYAELMKSADTDGDGVPDALQAAMARARKASEAAQARYAALKAALDKDGDGVPDRLKGLSAEAQRALDEARAKVAELTKAAQDRLGGPKAGPGGTPGKTA
jgi:colicin import membrane protein